MSGLLAELPITNGSLGHRILTFECLKLILNQISLAAYFIFVKIN
jgi:hypothetical protein